MPHTKDLGAYDGVEIPLPETFYDDYATRGQAPEADMRIEDMFLSQDMKLREEYYGTETGTGGNEDFREVIVALWKQALDGMTTEQRSAWDEYYLPINEEYASAGLVGDDLLRWKYRRYMEDYLTCVLSVDEMSAELDRLRDYYGDDAR